MSGGLGKPHGQESIAGHGDGLSRPVTDDLVDIADAALFRQRPGELKDEPVESVVMCRPHIHQQWDCGDCRSRYRSRETDEQPHNREGKDGPFVSQHDAHLQWWRWTLRYPRRLP